jgi:hypothetical protein
MWDYKSTFFHPIKENLSHFVHKSDTLGSTFYSFPFMEVALSHDKIVRSPYCTIQGKPEAVFLWNPVMHTLQDRLDELDLVSLEEKNFFTRVGQCPKKLTVKKDEEVAIATNLEGYILRGWSIQIIQLVPKMRMSKNIKVLFVVEGKDGKEKQDAPKEVTPITPTPTPTPIATPIVTPMPTPAIPAIIVPHMESRFSALSFQPLPPLPPTPDVIPSPPSNAPVSMEIEEKKDEKKEEEKPSLKRKLEEEAPVSSPSPSPSKRIKAEPTRETLDLEPRTHGECGDLMTQFTISGSNIVQEALAANWERNEYAPKKIPITVTHRNKHHVNRIRTLIKEKYPFKCYECVYEGRILFQFYHRKVTETDIILEKLKYDMDLLVKKALLRAKRSLGVVEVER